MAPLLRLLMEGMAETTLLLVRHAHTEANEHGRTPMMAGWSEIPLSATGERQLEIAALQFPLDGEVPVIYSSPSQRAMRTASAIAHRREVRLLRGLREISCGIVDGRAVADVKRDFPDLWRRNEEQSDPSFAWPGGESYGRFRRRVLRTLRAIAAVHPGDRVLVVTHAGVVSQVIGYIRGESPARWEPWRPGNLSITTVRCADGDFRLAAFDERDHLNVAESRQRGG